MWFVFPTEAEPEGFGPTCWIRVRFAPQRRWCWPWQQTGVFPFTSAQSRYWFLMGAAFSLPFDGLGHAVHHLHEMSSVFCKKTVLEIWILLSSKHDSIKSLNLTVPLTSQGLDFSPDNGSIIAYSLILLACVTGKIALAAKAFWPFAPSKLSMRSLFPRATANQRVVLWYSELYPCIFSLRFWL